MKKLIITLIALTSVLINPVLASDISVAKNNEVVALLSYDMPNLFEDGMRSMNRQADRQVAQTTRAVTAKLDLDLAQQDQTDQVLENLKHEQDVYLLGFMHNTVVNVSH